MMYLLYWHVIITVLCFCVCRDFANYCNSHVCTNENTNVLVYLYKKIFKATQENKSRLILIINSYVSVWGQSVYMCCSIAASKPFASEWSQTTLYGWKKQFWKTYISVSQRSVPNTAMIDNSSVQKISSFWVFWFL